MEVHDPERGRVHSREMSMATAKSGMNEHVATIQSRDDLAGFARDLIDDLRANPSAWENGTLDTFLDGFAAWLEDMDGYYKNRGEATPTEPNWRLIGEALLAAKVYE